jgi:sec-independent protein translocase protein TatB
VSFSETLFLFVLALVVFGPKKLPEIARKVGKILNEFRRASNEFKSQIEQEIAHLEVENKKPTILQPSPAPEGTASRTLNAAPSEPAPATLAASPETPSADDSNSTVIATEAIASADPVQADAVTSEPSRSAATLPSAQDIPQQPSQEIQQSPQEGAQLESQPESQESHA